MNSASVCFWSASRARKNWSCVTSAAAMRLPTSPVMEIALGVSRDSMSLLRTTSRRSPERLR